ncbi:hypothetical protein EYC59_00520 [Candidatus Saccharibacteria bacterium]|nr:MAG: hypothetical protein EYC59_00520 [Candidatus Saccharibacteria bacterium]
MPLTNKQRVTKKFPKPLLFAGLAVLLLVAVVIILEATNVTHFFRTDPQKQTYEQTPTTGGASTNSQKGEPQANASSDPSSQPGDTKSNSGSDTTATLASPSGDFVSNHHPNLGSYPAPNTLSSVCTTTPGASCTITFKNNGVTKSLPKQTADRAGSVYWNSWTLQSIGLTAGSWQVQAVATLGDQTKTADDAMALVVAQ